MNSLNGLKHEKGQNKNKNFRHSTTLNYVMVMSTFQRSTQIVELGLPVTTQLRGTARTLRMRTAILSRQW